ncbi:MAG: hypothetical protein R2838_19030 [Caldilineaceae bacterium]
MKTHRTILIAITAVLKLQGCCWLRVDNKPPARRPASAPAAPAKPPQRPRSQRRRPHRHRITAAPATEATDYAADTETAAASAPADAVSRGRKFTQTETFVIVPEESEARYSINEVFIADNNALVTAIGAPPAITGPDAQLRRLQPSTFDEFVVDISLLRSDRSRRPCHPQPLAGVRPPSRWPFKVTEVLNPADPAEGRLSTSNWWAT